MSVVKRVMFACHVCFNLVGGLALRIGGRAGTGRIRWRPLYEIIYSGKSRVKLCLEMLEKVGRGEWIRTTDLLVANPSAILHADNSKQDVSKFLQFNLSY